MRHPFPALLVLLLSACGTAPTESVVRAGQTAVPAAQFTREVFDLTNAARAQARVCGATPYAAAPALAYDSRLEASAQAHAQDMAAKNYFSHDSQDGRTFSQRITATGYPWAVAAENIAAGQTTPQEVVQAWLDSPNHCAEIMAADLHDVGIGYVVATGGKFGTYWVQDFGTQK
ncbi:CAP domain-containing protein [Deinococcus yunweiensis]|uniref:CAP domain-containing protein n=1 Tax=Deinococcus yunweiensis TaxID=367282 RepID=UPI00398F8DC7